MEGQEREKLTRTKEDGNKMATRRIDFNTKHSPGWGSGPPGAAQSWISKPEPSKSADGNLKKKRGPEVH